MDSSGREIAAFQLQAADAEEALAALQASREPWRAFVTKVHWLVLSSAGKPWPSDDPQFRERVMEADRDRLALKTQIGTLAVIADPLAQFLRTTFLQPQDGLYALLGRRSGSGWVQQMDEARFDWLIAECNGILNEAEQKLVSQRDRARRQAHLLEQQLDSDRAFELERLALEHWSFKGLWKRVTKTRLGRFVAWTVVTLLAGLLTAYGVPAIAKTLAAIWKAIHSWFAL